MRARSASIPITILFAAFFAGTATALIESPAPRMRSRVSERNAVTVYFRDGRTMRAKREPVYLFGRAVFTTTEGRPVNVAILEIDRRRTESQGRGPALASPAVLTNRELKNVGGRVSAVEIGEINPEDPLGLARSAANADSGEGREDDGGSPPPRTAAPAAPQADLRDFEMQSLNRQRADLQTTLMRLQAQKSAVGSDPAGTASIDAQIRSVNQQIADVQARISAAQRRR